MTKRQGERLDGVVARIVRSTDGGPIRQISKHGGAKPTGTFVSLKAGNRAMPWESIKCELPALELAEVASPVVSLLAQPHRLELYVRGRRSPLIYFPDLELTVEPGLYNRLIAKQPFAEAMLEWRPDRSRSGSYRTIIVEVKDDDDPRNDDRQYQRKLHLAAKVYQNLGFGFVVVVHSRDLAGIDLDLMHEVALDRYTAVSPIDTDICMRWLTDSGGAGTLGGLGSGPVNSD